MLVKNVSNSPHPLPHNPPVEVYKQLLSDACKVVRAATDENTVAFYQANKVAIDYGADSPERCVLSDLPEQGRLLAIGETVEINPALLVPKARAQLELSLKPGGSLKEVKRAAR